MEQLQGLFAVFGGNGMITGLGNGKAGHLQDIGVVIDQEDGFFRGHGFIRNVSRRDLRGGLFAATESTPVLAIIFIS
jgi:hypothetical protein